MPKGDEQEVDPNIVKLYLLVEQLETLMRGVEERVAKQEAWRISVLKDNEPGVISAATLPDNDDALFAFEILHQPGMNVEQSRLVNDQELKYGCMRMADNGKAFSCLVRVHKDPRAIVGLLLSDNRLDQGFHCIPEAEAVKGKERWPARSRLIDWTLLAEKVSLLLGQKRRPGEVWRIVLMLLQARVLAVKNGKIIVNEHLDIDALSR